MPFLGFEKVCTKLAYPPSPQVRFHTNFDHHPSPPTIVRTIWIPLWKNREKENVILHEVFGGEYLVLVFGELDVVP